MDKPDFPPEGAAIFDHERVIEEATQQILLHGLDRFPAMTRADAHRFAMMTMIAHDQENVRIGCMAAEDVLTLSDLDAPLCDDCKSKAH